MRSSGARCGVPGASELAVLRHAIELIAEHHHTTVELAGACPAIPGPRRPGCPAPAEHTAAWIERHYPAAFCAAALRVRPAGCGSRAELLAAARRHAVPVRGVDLHRSDVHARLEPTATYGWPAVRLGLSNVPHLGAEFAGRIVAERGTGGRFTGIPDLTRRAGLRPAHLELLATAGAFGCFGLNGRQALRVARATECGTVPR